MNEIWKDIKDYEGLYQVSNFGRIKSFQSRNNVKELIMQPKLKKAGYYEIKLRNKDKKPKFFLIHRLVAQAFIPNPNDYPCVNHKDENKQNNFANNLEWCTKAYNNSYGSRLERVSNTNKLRREVLQYDLEGNFIREYKSVTEAGKKNNIWASVVSCCCRGVYKRAGNYVFKFKNKENNNDNKAR